MRPEGWRWLIVLAGLVVFAAAPAPPGSDISARKLMQSGVAHQWAGDNLIAIKELSQAIASGALPRTDKARALFDRGVAFDSLGDTRSAITDYSAALHIDPGLSPALNNRGNAYRRTGKLEAAVRDYNAALQCPGAAQEYAYFGLGQIAVERADVERARDFFQKALDVNPTYAAAAESLAALPKRPSAPASAGARSAPEPASPRAVRISHVLTESGPVLRQGIEEGGARRARTLIQVGAFRDRQSAAEGWKRIVASTGELLVGGAPITVPVDLPGKGRLWRLRTAVPGNAHQLCAALRARNQACLVATD